MKQLQLIIIPLFVILSLLSCSKSPLFGPVEKDSQKEKNLSRHDSLSANPHQDMLEKYYSMPSTPYYFSIEWKQGPSLFTHGPSSLHLRFWHRDDGNIYGPYIRPTKRVCLLLWMEMPDGVQHGSSPVEIKELESHEDIIYGVHQIYFIMPGLWQMIIRLVSPEQECSHLKDTPFLYEKVFELDVE